MVAPTAAQKSNATPPFLEKRAVTAATEVMNSRYKVV